MADATRQALIGIGVGQRYFHCVGGLPQDTAAERRFRSVVWRAPNDKAPDPPELDWLCRKELRQGLAKKFKGEVLSLVADIGATGVGAVGLAIPTKEWVRDPYGSGLFPKIPAVTGQRFGPKAPFFCLPHPVAVALGYLHGRTAQSYDPGEYLIIHSDHTDAYAAVVHVRPKAEQPGAVVLLAEKHPEQGTDGPPPTENTVNNVLREDFRVPPESCDEAKLYLVRGEDVRARELSKADAADWTFDDLFDRLEERRVGGHIEDMVEEACQRAGVRTEALKGVWPSGDSGLLAEFAADFGPLLDPFFLARGEPGRPAAEGALLYASLRLGGAPEDLLLPCHPEYGIVIERGNDPQLVTVIPAEAPLPAEGTQHVELGQERAPSELAGKLEIGFWCGLGRCLDTTFRAEPARAGSMRDNEADWNQATITMTVAEKETRIEWRVCAGENVVASGEIPKDEFFRVP